MSSSTVVSVKDSNAVFTCPSGSLLGVWSLSTDGQMGMVNIPAGVYRMDTRGDNCYMEYSFTATGVSVNILGNFDHGVYSCQLDNGSPQWFNSNAATPSYGVGCGISGLSNNKHTLRVANAPMSGWALTVQNITLTTGDAFTGTTAFTSGWAAYQLPSNLTSQAAASTVTTVTTVTASSSGNHVSTAAFASVAAILATLFIGSTIAAVYFWVRDSRFRRDHQWTQAISAAPIAYTTEPTTSSRTEYDPLTPPPQPPSMADQYPPSYQISETSSSFGVRKAQ